MLTYYKFNQSYFRLSSDNSFFEQINNFPNEKVIIYGQIAESVQILNEAKLRDNWAEVTQEEYNTVKAEVLAFLSAN
jgi:predicted DNA-binding protein with PD1-like motif